MSKIEKLIYALLLLVGVVVLILSLLFGTLIYDEGEITLERLFSENNVIETIAISLIAIGTGMFLNEKK